MSHTLFQIIRTAYTDYAQYLWHEITHPHSKNYLLWLIGLSLLVLSIEYIVAKRNRKSVWTRDFGIETCYLFFNFFLFSLIGYNALSEVGVHFWENILALLDLNSARVIDISSLSPITQLIVTFILIDFIQYWIHRLLHRVPFLWSFHKIHHSAKQLSFVTHFRFHWMETIVYKTIQYIPLSFIGIGLDDFFLAHIVALTLGHLNHAQVNWSYGWLGKLLNNPAMHKWHHTKALPAKHKHGINFGLSLSVWDYLFGTAHAPAHAPDELGYPEDEEMPRSLLKQWLFPFQSENTQEKKG